MRVLNVEDYPPKHYEIKSALNQLGITDIPVIFCSSFRLDIPGVLGCVHYTKNTDLREELKKLIDNK